MKKSGGLLWWTFRDTASPPEKLARCALSVRFPPIFLPVPFPVDSKVAFGRALQRATANVPAAINGSWRADRMTKLPNVDGRVRAWAKKYQRIEGLEFGVLESWQPTRPGRPWLVRIWLALDPSKKMLHTFAATGAPGRGTKPMMDRAKHMFNEELESATAPEIGDGIVSALEYAGGVKLRAGLWSVPGEHGIKLVKSAKEYLSNVGNSDAGMLILFKTTRSADPGAGSLVEIGLLDEVEALAAEIHPDDLETIGTGALRTLWDRIEIMREKLQANEELIGRRAANKLRAKLKPAEKYLRQAARAKKVTLNRTTGSAAIDHLCNGISALRHSARQGDVEGLKEAERLLVRGQSAALTAGIPHLLARLRKLTNTSIHVREKVYFEALERAAAYLEKQARCQALLSKQTLNGTNRRKSKRSI